MGWGSTLLKHGEPRDAAMCERVHTHVNAGQGLENFNKCFSLDLGRELLLPLKQTVCQVCDTWRNKTRAVIKKK